VRADLRLLGSKYPTSTATTTTVAQNATPGFLRSEVIAAAFLVVESFATRQIFPSNTSRSLLPNANSAEMRN
jgi:hypothetical protein